MEEEQQKSKNGFIFTWKKLIIFAILAGIYSAIMAIIPITNNTSFKDITITFEVWILFGIFIIMHSKSALDSGLKCFIFFLISQPLIYLIQVPFSTLGFGLFSYYRYWFMVTLLTFPMGFIGYFMKKDKWWGLLILTPILVFLGIHYSMFLGNIIYNFPYHILSTIFCLITLIAYPLCIFKNIKIKIVGIIISIIIIIIMTIITLSNNTTYKTTVLVNGGSAEAVFNDSYTVYLEDKSFGDVKIVYTESLEDYTVEAEFKKAGKTNLILEDSNGNKQEFELEIKNSSYEITKK